MVYAGWINKSIVARLQQVGCNALGLSGADANAIPSVRRSPVPIDFGFVGDPDPSKINAPFIAQLVDNGIIPVFCAITHDGQAHAKHQRRHHRYSVATALSAHFETTLYCFEKGVLRMSMIQQA